MQMDASNNEAKILKPLILKIHELVEKSAFLDKILSVDSTPMPARVENNN